LFTIPRFLQETTTKRTKPVALAALQASLLVFY